MEGQDSVGKPCAQEHPRKSGDPAPTKSFLDAAVGFPPTCDTLATTTFREVDGHPRGCLEGILPPLCTRSRSGRGGHGGLIFLPGVRSPAGGVPWGGGQVRLIRNPFTSFGESRDPAGHDFFFR